MGKFLLRRLCLAVLIVFLGAFLVYGVLRCLPASYVEKIARQRAARPGGKSYLQWLTQLNQVYGLDKGVLSGFFAWLGSAVKGDFGESWLYNQPVVRKFASVIGYSLGLNLAAFCLEIFIGIPLGVRAARKPYGRADAVISVLSLVGVSLPAFFLASLLKYFFSVRLGWFDLYGIVGRSHDQLSLWGQAGDVIWHMVLPVLTLALVNMGPLTRYTRANMLEALSSDCVRAARAKGLSEGAVLRRHALRLTYLPLISYMSYLLPQLFTGSLITETLFQIPGVGYIAYNAMVAGDIPFTMFYLVFLILLTQVSLLAADILYAAADPRVRVN